MNELRRVPSRTSPSNSGIHIYCLSAKLVTGVKQVDIIHTLMKRPGSCGKTIRSKGCSCIVRSAKLSSVEVVTVMSPLCAAALKFDDVLFTARHHP